MKGDRFSINWNDLLKGLVMAVVLPVLTTVYETLQHGELVFDWPLIGKTAVLGLVGYLIKNFFSDNVKAAENTLEAAAKKQNP